MRIQLIPYNFFICLLYINYINYLTPYISCFEYKTIFELEHEEEIIKLNNLEPLILKDLFQNIFSYNKIEVNLLVIEINPNNDINFNKKFDNFTDYKANYFKKTSLINLFSKNSNIQINRLSSDDKAI